MVLWDQDTYSISVVYEPIETAAGTVYAFDKEENESRNAMAETESVNTSIKMVSYRT